MNSVWIAFHIIRRTLGRKRGVLVYLILPPVVVSFLISLVSGYDDKHFALTVANRDAGTLGAVLIEELQREPWIVVRMAGTQLEAEDLVNRNMTDSAVIIPESYTAGMLEGKAPAVELRFSTLNDGAYTVRKLLESKTGLMAEAVRTAREQTPGRSAEAKVKELYGIKHAVSTAAEVRQEGMVLNPVSGSGIGALLFFVMMLASGSVSMILDDRRTRTMQRMFTAPLRAYEIAAGNFLGCFVLGTFQIGVALLGSRLFLGSVFGYGLLYQWIVLECFLLAALGIASAVAGLVQQDSQINAVTSLIITPTCMIGGCFWPLYTMPEFMQKMANFVPQKWALEGVQMLQGGAGIGEVKVHLGILLLFAFILLSFGSIVMKPGED